eukprot:CAMPEP_0195141254 /NCGR_PEP_ID=MMETSP0448-20130528/162577_1 /TAXON_ID=66468 /ORGANISM="Heterocapsa triquestra, Strain CCMP 448" /LENGTH=801 /DNA_ID=CAMNT_0040179633 /DNA_START=8 /DNA_END=2410 /DNA_ORIENTATION=+
MALPAIRRIVAPIMPPRKGKLGILSGLKGDEIEPAEKNAFSGVLPQLQLPPMGAGEDASKQQRPPPTPRTQQRRERKVSEDIEVASLRRELLGREGSIIAGQWDADRFCDMRKRALEHGRWGTVAGLTTVAAEASKQVLDAGHYGLRGSEVWLPRPGLPEWFGFDSVNKLETEEQPFPLPLVCAPLGPLEVVAMLTDMFPDKPPIAMSFEMTDFLPGGTLVGPSEVKSPAQQELLLRTSIHRQSRGMAITCHGGAAPPREHLMAEQDPYLMICNDVQIFRGSAEQGYPFLQEKDIADVSVLMTGRAVLRPQISKKGEFFSQEEDMVAYMDRLHLIALAGMQLGRTMAARPNTSGSPRSARPDTASSRMGTEPTLGGEGVKPILVISAHDLTVAAAQQPRMSIATGLKSWGKVHARAFKAVVVACGNESTASLMDKTINSDLYATVVRGKMSALKEIAYAWHWSLPLLKLSVNPVLANIGERLNLFKSAPARTLTTLSRATSMNSRSVSSESYQYERRSGSIAVDMINEVLEAHAQGQDSPLSSHRGNSVGAMCGNSFNVANAGRHAKMLLRHSTSSGSGPAPARQTSQPTILTGSDSRSTHARAVANRLRQAPRRLGALPSAIEEEEEDTSERKVIGLASAVQLAQEQLNEQKRAAVERRKKTYEAQARSLGIEPDLAREVLTSVEETAAQGGEEESTQDYNQRLMMEIDSLARVVKLNEAHSWAMCKEHSKDKAATVKACESAPKNADPRGYADFSVRLGRPQKERLGSKTDTGEDNHNQWNTSVPEVAMLTAVASQVSV